MWVKNCIRHRLSLMVGEKTRLGARTFNKTASCRGFSVAAQAAVWNNDHFIYHFFKILIDE